MQGIKLAMILSMTVFEVVLSPFGFFQETVILSGLHEEAFRQGRPK